MKSSLKFAVACAAIASAQQAAAQDSALDALLAQDARLAAIAGRLLTANAHLCRKTMPVTGMVVHSRDQYRRDFGGDSFANGAVAVAAVVSDSPAARADLKPGDGLVEIAGVPTASLKAEGEAPVRDSVFDLLAGQPVGQPLALTALRGGREASVALEGVPGCRALVEIRAQDALGARSDGRVIQVNYGFAVAASDEQLAVAFAHELGHLVLEHRRRLSSAGVEKGFFGEFGRNQQLNRHVEVEADRLSVHLLANAGYDPRIAPAFWRTSLGRRAGGGVFHSRTYPSAEARAQLLEREIADYLGAGIAPTWPGHLLARRDKPFTRE